MLKTIIVSVIIAILGFIPLMGLPGALILPLAQPVVNFLHGPLAFQTWLSKMGPNVWPIAIIISVVWPLSIPMSYLAVQKMFPAIDLWQFKKVAVFAALILCICFVGINVWVCTFSDIKRLDKNELYVAAVENDNVKILQTLEAQGLNDADVIPDPLYSAVFQKKNRAAEHLIKVRNDLNKFHSAIPDASSDGGGPLHTATRVGNRRLMELLLARGASPNTTNALGQTPAHLVSDFWEGDGWELVLLRDHGAKLTAVDNYGNTALSKLTQSLNHWKNMPAYVRILLEAGVDPHLKNNEGKSAFDYARENVHLDTLTLLNEWKQR